MIYSTPLPTHLLPMYFLYRVFLQLPIILHIVHLILFNTLCLIDHLSLRIIILPLPYLYLRLMRFIIMPLPHMVTLLGGQLLGLCEVLILARFLLIHKHLLNPLTLHMFLIIRLHFIDLHCLNFILPNLYIQTNQFLFILFLRLLRFILLLRLYILPLPFLKPYLLLVTSLLLPRSTTSLLGTRAFTLLFVPTAYLGIFWIHLSMSTLLGRIWRLLQLRC